MWTRHVAATAVAAAIAAAAPLAHADIILDQIGAGAFTATSLSSSQFAPGSDRGISTVDNFTIEASTLEGTPVRLSRVEATVAGIQNFSSFDLVDSWTVQIYSSLSASTESITGDVYSATFDAPDMLTTGYSSWLGSPVELATFDIDVVLPAGDYWIAVVMGNDGNLNGTVGIAHGTIGDGGAYFSGPGVGDTPVQLGNPAGYRIFGEPIPAPGGLAVLAVALLAGRSRRRAVKRDA